MLCRLESHRVVSLSLPLETRPLPNGDEVAVRSNAVVLRLIFLQGSSATANWSDQSPPRPAQAQGMEDALGGGDGAVAARGGRRYGGIFHPDGVFSLLFFFFLTP